MRVFGDETTVEPEDLALAGSSATKVDYNIDLLSTHVWPKLVEKSQDQLLTVCKKWGDVATTLNFPRHQTINWAYTKCLIPSCTQSSLKVVRMEEGQDEVEWRTVHFKCLCQFWELLTQENFFSWMYDALINKRYALDNNYHRLIFKARHSCSPGKGHYFGVTRSSAGRELEVKEYKAMVQTTCREYFQMLSLDVNLFN